MRVCGAPGAADFTRERQMALKEHEAGMSFPRGDRTDDRREAGMSDQIDRTMLPIRLPLTDEEQIQLAWPAVIEAARR